MKTQKKFSIVPVLLVSMILIFPCFAFAEAKNVKNKIKKIKIV